MIVLCFYRIQDLVLYNNVIAEEIISYICESSKTSSTMSARNFIISIICILFCASLGAKNVTWLNSQGFFVTTYPNATVYTCKITPLTDNTSDARTVVNFIATKGKVVKKPTSVLVRGYANRAKQLHYDTYVVEMKGKLYYLPMEYVENNDMLNGFNAELTQMYSGYVTRHSTVKAELDSLTTYYFNESKTQYQYCVDLKPKIEHQIDSVNIAAKKEYEDLRQSQYDNWYNALPSSGKRAADRLEITESSLSKPNSVGGCDYNFNYRNKSQKTIKYLTVYVDIYNAVNDLVRCEIKGSPSFIGQDTGPVAPNKFSYCVWDCIIYNWSAKYVKFYKIVIEYTDGSSYTIASADVQRLLSSPKTNANYQAFVNKYGYSSDYVANAKKPYQAKLKECEAQIKAWQQRINYLNSGNFKYPLKYTGSDYNPVFERISSVFNNEADLATQLDTFEKDNLIK